MTKILAMLGGAAMVIALTVSVSLAIGNGQGIKDSPHDFSTADWNTDAEICNVCHVPHDHNRDEGDVGLLWSHNNSSQTYIMYAEDTHIHFIDGASDTEPTGTAKMCLACHDGTIGIDEFAGNADESGQIPTGKKLIDDFAGDVKIPGDRNIGDLSNTHPVSVVYDSTKDTALRDAETTAMGLSGSIADVLEDNKVQCSSCHDVHDQEAIPATALLRVPQNTKQGGSPSMLCLVCHIK